MLMDQNAINQFKKEFDERKKVIGAIAAIVKGTAFEQIPNLRFHENLRLGLTYVDEYIKGVYDAFKCAEIDKKEEHKEFFDIIEKFVNNRDN